jgi:hypothetical protein
MTSPITYKYHKHEPNQNQPTHPKVNGQPKQLLDQKGKKEKRKKMSKPTLNPNQKLPPR